jgi:glycosyltransferase involved in cell wall biosynthesis
MTQKATKNVFFLPFQNQSLMPVIYRIGEIYVLPSSHNETWGLAVNEAMACGKPVLVSDKVGCAVDLVKPGENGYIFKLTNLEDLMQKITLFENNLEKFGEKSKEIINDWSFEEIAKEIEKEFR